MPPHTLEAEAFLGLHPMAVGHTLGVVGANLHVVPPLKLDDSPDFVLGKPCCCLHPTGYSHRFTPGPAVGHINNTLIPRRDQGHDPQSPVKLR